MIQFLHFFLLLLDQDLFILDHVAHIFVFFFLRFVNIVRVIITLLQLCLFFFGLLLLIFNLLLSLGNLFLNCVDFALEVLPTLLSSEDGMLFNLQEAHIEPDERGVVDLGMALVAHTVLFLVSLAESHVV